MQPRRWAEFLTALVLAAAALAQGVASAEEKGWTGEPFSITDLVDGPGTDWGKSETEPIEVPGSMFDMKPLPKEKVVEPVNEDDITTRIMTVGLGSFGVPVGGRVGVDQTSPELYPSFEDGWNASTGGTLQFGFDSGFIGVFVDLGFHEFKSKGRQSYGAGNWYSYSDIRMIMLCPGFKLQFTDWMKYLHAGRTRWDVTWYDYMLHSFPYVKVGVGPIYLDHLEVSSDSNPEARDYWSSGLSYTFFAMAGLEWRPFNRSVSFVLEAGIQAYVFTTETALSRSPDMMISVPIRLGLALTF